MMPVYLELTLWNYHDMLEIQIQHQIVKIKNGETLTAAFDNKPHFIFGKGNPFEESHFQEIFKGVIVVFPIGCYFLFYLPCKIFLSSDLKGV